MATRLDVDSPLPGTRHTASGGVTAVYTWRASSDATGQGVVHGDLAFGPDAEGLPGYVHGGALSAVCDEAMGMATWCEGHCAPGARVEVDFLRPVRAGDRAILTARVDRIDGRKLACSAEVRVGDVVVVRATGVFVSVPFRDPTPFAGWPGLERFTA